MVDVHLLDGNQARSLADELRCLYAEVYAEAPYNEGPQHVARFVEHFAQEVDTPGFALASALDGEDLIGAAYGWTMAAGQWFRAATTEPPMHILGVPKFGIMEWMVRTPYRGKGVGRHLLNTILANRAEPYAILASNPEAPARRLYDRLGWKHCGTTKPELLPSMDILARRLGDGM